MKDDFNDGEFYNTAWIEYKYKHDISHAAVALIMVKMMIQSMFPLSKYSKKSNMMHHKIQIMFDRALHFNWNPLFLDYCWLERYNTMTEMYALFNSYEQTMCLVLIR